MEHIPAILKAVADILDSTVVLITVPLIVVCLAIDGQLGIVILKFLDIFVRRKRKDVS